MKGLTGLTSQEVRERVSRGLHNQFSAKKSKKGREIVLENLFSVFNLIIFAIMAFLLVFYLKTSDDRLLLDSIGVLSVAVLNTLIAIIQEWKAKRALDRVHLLLKKEVKVLRESQEVFIDQKEIVVDDLVFLERGDQVVVDGRVIWANHLEIDASLLTGESLPVLKKVEDEILSGCFCLSGTGLYRAEKIGKECYAAKITGLAKRFKFNLSLLQIKINFIVKALFAVAVLLVIGQILFKSGDLDRVDFVRKLSTIAISLVPQGLVLMSSVTFALGIYRISKLGAIVQKLNAIESFSNVKVVCTDKTGTLTQNKLAVKEITILDDRYTLEEAKKWLGTYGKFSSDKNATLRTLEGFPSFDPVTLIDEIPFTSEKKRSLIAIEKDRERITLILGAFDILIERARDDLKERSRRLFDEKGLKVYRNLLLGKITSQAPLDQIKDQEEGPVIEPLCLVSITDQVRSDVMEAIELFQKNDIQIKILSGDSAPAIQAVARQIGWEIKEEELISGDQMDGIDERDFSSTVQNKTVFARLKPEHKLRIIKALKKQNLYTAMIGDGVNDLPAIKEADIGIAMEEGSKITKEVADIVLLKNKFSLLPHIFDEGNKIVNTVSSVAKLFLTKNFMAIYLTLLSLLFLWHFPLTPRRVALINVFSIGLPSMFIAFKNSNVSKTKKFLEDLFTFSALSALIIVVAGYLGLFYVDKHFAIGRKDLQMVMMSILIICTTSNLLAVALHKKEKETHLYWLYSAALICLYVFLATTKMDNLLLNLLREFYEITYLRGRFWVAVGVISFGSSICLLLLQKVRKRWLLG